MRLGEPAEFSHRRSDRAYFQWVDEHSDGLIMNTRASPSEEYLNVHHAWCKLITMWRGHKKYHHTTNHYGKVCASSWKVLERWAQKKFGPKAKLTKRCRCWEVN